MLSSDLRRSYVDFYTSRGHTEIPGSTLIGDDTVLFTSAGMQPLIPYFDGTPHPSGRRLVNVQRCLRTVDIDEVGDDRHLTCFEMLGNWSLGDYYKHESLSWTLEWLLEIGLPFERLGVTVHESDPYARAVWRQLGVPDNRVRVLGDEDNWWGPPGPHGPCGPDSEIFYIRDDGRWLEIGNNVFIVHDQDLDGTRRGLPQHNVDVGLGLERILALLQGVETVYETDLFKPTLEVVRQLSTTPDTRAERIVTDHVRASLLLVQDGVTPSNTGRGYVLRRLVRRAIRQGRKLGIEGPFLHELTKSDVLEAEERRFGRTLNRGLRELRKLDDVDGRQLFRLFETYGLPPELTLEELGVSPGGWREDFDRAASEHRERSRQRP
ncbi:alanine--tRNA ligase-related protein [Solirubrobacter soli]|uniref:alanine--tRNA ligase-related protein n=1 Tax=Solirubrobacter soli TaxID=363832 RepID=UPI000404B27E|nr:alanine--tRNA ligase-related protein [Solirubrobacter soli]